MFRTSSSNSHGFSHSHDAPLSSGARGRRVAMAVAMVTVASLLVGCGAKETKPRATVTVTSTRASATTSAAPTTSQAPKGETLRAGGGVDAEQFARLRAGESVVDSVEICLKPENLATGEGCAKSMTLTRDDVLNKSDDEVAGMILGAMFETILEDDEYAAYLDEEYDESEYGDLYGDGDDNADYGTDYGAVDDATDQAATDDLPAGEGGY